MMLDQNTIGHTARQHERVSFLTGIILESASGRREARISDISYGGCYIDSIFSVDVGDDIRFELVHPNGATLLFTGNVAYHFEGVGFGVKFTDVNEEQRLFLDRVIR